MEKIKLNAIIGDYLCTPIKDLNRTYIVDSTGKKVPNTERLAIMRTAHKDQKPTYLVIDDMSSGAIIDMDKEPKTRRLAPFAPKGNPIEFRTRVLADPTIRRLVEHEIMYNTDTITAHNLIHLICDTDPALHGINTISFDEAKMLNKIIRAVDTVETRLAKLKDDKRPYDGMSSM